MSLGLMPLRGGQGDFCHQAAHKYFLECFLLYFDHSSPLYSPAVQAAAIWGSYGGDEALAPGLPFANA